LIAVTEEEEDRWCPMDMSVNILPLLDYCRSRPDLQVEVATYRRVYRDGMLSKCPRRNKCVDVLLALAKNPKLQDWLDDTVVAVRLSNNFHLSFGIKEGEWTAWMSRLYKELAFGDPNTEFRTWLEDTGFAFSDVYDTYFMDFKMGRGSS
jgi:hypothetical protein